MHSGKDRLLVGLLAAVALAGGAAGLLLLGGAPPAEAGAVPSEAPLRTSKDERARSDLLEIQPVEAAGREGVESAATTVPAVAEPGAAVRAAVRLRVLFQGEPIELDATRLEVSPLWRTRRGQATTEGFSIRLGQEHLVGYARGAPQIELDVSALFRFSRPEALVLRAESEGLMGLSVLPCDEEAELLVGSLWMEAGTTVTGQVVPAGRGQVGVFLVREGRPVGVLVEEGVVRSDGGFELALPANNVYALCAFRRDARPGTELFALGYAGRQQVPAVRLPEPESIAGRLSLMDSCERATVTARLLDGEGHFAIGSSDFVWYRGRFEWRSRSAPGGADCTAFRLTGLAPAEYELGISGVRNTDRVSVGRVPTVTAWAPAAAVDLSPRLARVRLQLEPADEPASGSRRAVALVQDFGARGTSHLQALARDDGVAEFWLDPEAPAWVRGRESTRFLPAELDGRAPRLVPGESGATR